MGSVHDDNGTLGSIESGTPATKSVVRPPGAVEQLLETEAHITRIGSYVPLHKLGQGGMGVVYAAYDEKLDRKVALKLLRSRGSEVARLRLIREARAMAKLSHPNVAQVYGIEESGEQLCIVVEFVDGVTLKAWLAEATRTREEILDVFRSAGLGLAAAHAAGLVHRDFKPDNVMIRRDKRVLVMDFGLVHTDKSESTDDGDANALDGESGQLTRTGAIVGTPAYMAPEQFLGRDTDARSDQFSFCVALWEALMGQRPFIAESVEKLAEAVTSGRFAQVERRDVPVWLREVMMRGLAVESAQRWPSMDALLGALARDPGQRRRWVIGIAAGLGIGALIAGAVVREVDRRENALADSQAALAQQQSELEQQRRAIDDAANIQRAQQATLLVGERRGLEALVLAVRAAGPYGPDYMNAPTPVLQALFDVQTVSIAGQIRVFEAEPQLQHVLFTPDDEHVVGVMYEPRAMVWTLDGELVGRLDGHVPDDGSDRSINGCAIRLSSSGEPIEILTANKAGQVWNAAGELLFSPKTGPIDADGIWNTWTQSAISIDPVLWPRERNIAISPTGGTIVFYDGDLGKYHLWQGWNHTVLGDDDGFRGQLSAGFSENGARVVMSPGHGRLVSHDEQQGLLGRSLDEPVAFAIAVAPDGSQSVTAEPGAPHIRDETGRSMHKLEGHTASVKAVVYNHAGTELATGSDDRTIRLWSRSGQLNAVLMGHGGRVVGLRFTSDDSRLASASDDATVRLWNILPPLDTPPFLGSAGKEPSTVSKDGALAATHSPGRLYRTDGAMLVESTRPFLTLGFAPDSSMFVVIDESGYLRIWDRDGHIIGEADAQAVNPRRIVFASDSSRFFLLADSDRHCIWDRTGRCVARLALNDPVTHAVFSSDGTSLMTFAQALGTTRIWDGSGTLVGRIPSREFVHASPTSERVVTYASDEKPRLWTSSGEFVAELSGLSPSREDHHDVEYSPDGRRIALVVENILHVWNDSGELLQRVEVGDGASRARFAPDGRFIATAGDFIKIWSLDGELKATMDGHVDYIHALVFSPDGALLLTTSSDAVHLWDAASAQRLASLRRSGTRGPARFSTDGSRVIQGDIARIWLLPAAAMVRACEVLENFPEEYSRVSEICARVATAEKSPPP